MKGPIGFGRVVNIVMNIILGLCMSLVMLTAAGVPLLPEIVIEAWFASFCIGYAFGDIIPVASWGPAFVRQVEPTRWYRVLPDQLRDSRCVLRHDHFVRQHADQQPADIGLGSGVRRLCRFVAVGGSVGGSAGDHLPVACPEDRQSHQWLRSCGGSSRGSLI